MLIWKCFKADIYIILILQTIFQDIKLKDTYNAHDDLFHTGIKLLEYLDRTFLSDLVDTFYKLFSLHGIDLTYTCKMLRCESRDSFKSKFLSRRTDRISNGKDTRIKDTDDISCISLVHNMAGFRHHLLRLKKAHFLVTLNMINFLGRVKLAGTDPHKCDTVSVSLVHICLDLKYKG